MMLVRQGSKKAKVKYILDKNKYSTSHDDAFMQLETTLAFFCFTEYYGQKTIAS